MDRFGINIHQRTDLVPIAAELGASILRIDANWYDIQVKGPDDWQWDWLDAMVDACRSHSIIPYPTIGYSPPWMGERALPPNVIDWSRFLRTFGEHFMGRVEYVAIWNEPNIQGMFHGTVQQYVDQVLSPAATILRPRYKICAPELSTEGRWWVWLEKCLRLGAGYIDVLTVHCYQDQGRQIFERLSKDRPAGIPRWFPWPTPSVRQVARWATDLQHPIALTEFGWDRERLGEEEHMHRLDEFIAQLLQDQTLLAALYFQLIDDDNSRQGLLRQDGSKTPAAAMLRARRGTV